MQNYSEVHAQKVILSVGKTLVPNGSPLTWSHQETHFNIKANTWKIWFESRVFGKNLGFKFVCLKIGYKKLPAKRVRYLASQLISTNVFYFLS